MFLTLEMQNTTMLLSAYNVNNLPPSLDITTLLTSGSFLLLASMYSESSAKGRGSVALYNSVSVSKSLTMPSLQPQAIVLLQQLMEDAPVTLTSTHFVSAR
jgi:hypothetical protein